MAEALADDMDVDALGQTGGVRYSNRVECLAEGSGLFHLVRFFAWLREPVACGVGGVVGPASASGFDPVGGGRGDAEGVGDHGCGELRRELEQCGAATCPGVDAEGPSRSPWWLGVMGRPGWWPGDSQPVVGRDPGRGWE